MPKSTDCIDRWTDEQTKVYLSCENSAPEICMICWHFRQRKAYDKNNKMILFLCWHRWSSAHRQSYWAWWVDLVAMDMQICPTSLVELKGFLCALLTLCFYRWQGSRLASGYVYCKNLIILIWNWSYWSFCLLFKCWNNFCMEKKFVFSIWTATNSSAFKYNFHCFLLLLICFIRGRQLPIFDCNWFALCAAFTLDLLQVLCFFFCLSLGYNHKLPLSFSLFFSRVGWLVDLAVISPNLVVFLLNHAFFLPREKYSWLIASSSLMHCVLFTHAGSENKKKRTSWLNISSFFKKNLLSTFFTDFSYKIVQTWHCFIFMTWLLV